MRARALLFGVAVLVLLACSGTERMQLRAADGRTFERVLTWEAGCGADRYIPVPWRGSETVTTREVGGAGAEVMILTVPELGLSLCPLGTTVAWDPTAGRTVTSAVCSPIVCDESDDCPSDGGFAALCHADHRCR